MMRQWPEVVEKLAEHGPTMELVPHFPPDEGWPLSLHGVFQGEALVVEHDETQPFVRRPALVHGYRGGRKPPLINAAPVGAVCIQVFIGQFQAAAWDDI